MIRQAPIFSGIATVLCCATSVFAQDKTGLNLDETATGQPGGVAQYDMAQALFALAVTQKDAVLALTAAKLAAGVQMVDVERDGVQTPAAADGSADGGADNIGATSPADASQMLATARSLAAEDETLLALIEDTEMTGMRDQISGAQRQLNPLPPGAMDQWTVPFYGGSLAEIGVKGDGDTGLAVTIADENANRIICPARVDDRFYCDFVPRWNGYFTITVSNTGNMVNSYYLLTN